MKPHYRVELPPFKEGTLHAGRDTRLFVTYEGEAEREVPGVHDLRILTPLDGVVCLRVVLFGSVEVTHRTAPPDEPATLPPDVAIPPPGTVA